ncbi:MAG: hypothetical protein HYR88_06830, partial [Verrucomicrobia bacterium]|nr:hypothetical protein [Verrucomicrobiota bacterium]
VQVNPVLKATFPWAVGRDDNDWPAGNGGGPNATFVQENGVINPLPGNPANPEVNGQGDNDYYFAGEYSQTIDSVTALYGPYTPVGFVLANEESAERAFAAADNDLRYHFNLPASLKPDDLMTITFDALNLHTDGQADPRYGVEVYFNGVLVQEQKIIRPADLNIPITVPPFTASSVNAQVGPGYDNIVSLKGINYNNDGGGNWMGIDYVMLSPVQDSPSRATTRSRLTASPLSMAPILRSGLSRPTRRWPSEPSREGTMTCVTISICRAPSSPRIFSR